ncbi:hypothetical protein AVEN_182078-1, partial [Araneus ventricosus]
MILFKSVILNLVFEVVRGTTKGGPEAVTWGGSSDGPGTTL